MKIFKYALILVVIFAAAVSIAGDWYDSYNCANGDYLWGNTFSVTSYLGGTSYVCKNQVDATAVTEAIGRSWVLDANSSTILSTGWAFSGNTASVIETHEYSDLQNAEWKKQVVVNAQPSGIMYFHLSADHD